MKMFKKLLFAGLAFTTLNVSAQTVDEIIAKNTEALGGATKLATLNTAKMSGTMSANGQEFPITMTKSHMKGSRIDFEVMGTSNYQLVNTEKAIAFMPVMGMAEPKDMEAENYKQVSHTLDLQGNLFNYKEKGNTVEALAGEKVDGAEAHVLKLTTKAGAVINYYIDKKTNRIVKSLGIGGGQGGSDLETSYSDFKQNADGYWFPYTISTPNGPITMEKIETNIKLEDSIFKP